MKAVEVYLGQDGSITTAYYSTLERLGPIGVVAVNLFRAQKCSSRAKVYRGRRFKEAAYDRKSWSMQNLVETLAKHSKALGISYGWKQDPATLFGQEPSWVLYVDLPQGQVSFHSPTRLAGPDYGGHWDGQHKSAERILEFCDSVCLGATAFPPDSLTERQKDGIL